MKVYWVLFVVILWSGKSLAQAPAKSSTKEAPKSIFIIQVNGKEQVLSEGQDYQIDANTSISVKLADFRQFDIGTISFDYPSNFGFSYEEDLGYKNWTLDGNDFLIFYFEFDAKVEKTEFINEMLVQFGEGNYQVEEKPINVGAKLTDGTRANISILGQIITIECFELGQGEDLSRFIVFQDTRTVPESPSEEATKTLKMIEETLRYD
ncbi:MAG: hypothetical protein AAF985_05795 [Bacteroidota bacterium]